MCKRNTVRKNHHRGLHRGINKGINKGFTIIEMIVTMAVLAIVLTLSIAGLLAWQDWSNFNRQNEYARTLFVAAQNQLTEFDADGRLKELQDSLSGGVYDDKTARHYTAVGLNLTDHISALTNAEGNNYDDLGSLYPESGDKEEKDQALYQGEIVSLRARGGEYAAYLADPAGLKASDPDAYWVFELLGAYVYDTSILNGDRKDDGSGIGAAICVEITPDDGQVVAVMYSDRNDKFIYKAISGDPDGSTEETGVVDISDRSESYRKDRMVGYYGVDTLYTATKGEVLEPSVATVRLYNKEDFYLACRLSAKDRNLLTSRLTYTMNIHGSASDSDKLLTITLDGTKLKNQANAEVISCPVSRYDLSGNPVSLGELPVFAWLEADNTIHVVLDAADIQATSDLYQRALPYIRSNEENDNKAKFLKTFSYFRFGVKDENLYASVSAKGEDVVTSETMRNFGNLNLFLNQTAKHATFAGEEAASQDGKTAYSYSIKNARHLYNMRYIEDLSYEQEAGSPEAAANILGVTFQVKSDIDWKTFQNSGYLYNSYDTSGVLKLFSLNKKTLNENGEPVAVDPVNKYNCSFPSIARIRSRDTLTGDGLLGGSRKISGIHVSEVMNGLYGIYNSDTQGAVVELDKTRPAGFVNVNYGTMKNLQLDGIAVSGSRFVGGFCGINAGNIEQLETLNTDNTSVISGKEYVGGIIGFQMPTSEELVIKGMTNRARVEGVKAVGGITGMVRNGFSGFTDKIELSELTQLSETTKDLFKNNPKLSIRILECKNYGAVAGENSTSLDERYTSKTAEEIMGAAPVAADPEESRYIGGIVGYVYNQEKENGNGNGNKKDTIIIEGCTSAPLYDTDTIAMLTAQLTDQTKQEQMLKGVYVGGIVGYNYYGEIKDCSTRAEKGKEGCLFGYRYVGGIAGYHIGSSDGFMDTYTSVYGSKTGVNENHVVAYEYAGGITGCNAQAGELDSKGNSTVINTNNSKKRKDPENLEGILVPDAGRALDVKLTNWVNQGVIIAVNEYSGGITGYNTGWIYQCNSKVIPEVAGQCFATLYSGNYAGGITGYNNGIIGNTERKTTGGGKSTVIQKGEQIQTESYVKGHYYVGGIVGYNDVDAIVEDYEVNGGYVLGDEGSCFVGGYAGLNVSVDLLMDREKSEVRYIHSSPSRVEGSYLVGGVIGGNMINMADNPKVDTINGVFVTDNFLGALKGKAFVGGFIGYNLLFENDKNTKLVQTADESEKSRGAVYIVQKRLVDAFKESDEDASVSDTQKLVQKKVILDGLFENLELRKPAYSWDIGHLFEKGSVCITGSEDHNAVSYLGSISGEIFIGGVMGYNDANTRLMIKNVENETAVEATGAIAVADEQKLSDGSPRTTDYVGNPKTYTYSYAGGIIGKVSANTTLDNCSNISAETVKTAGTYTGGLCEVNEGVIQNCRVPNFGNGTQDYVGGLCALNKKEIKACTFEKTTVGGRNVVGGIVAENFGTISDIILSKPKVSAKGLQEENGTGDGVAGLYAAFNGAAGSIVLEDDISGTVRSEGRYVGMVAGVNEGQIEQKFQLWPPSKWIISEEKYLKINGKVEGYQAVGGLIGLNRSQDKDDKVKYFTNQASVTATNGNAGGIIGENLSQNMIWCCVNDGVVTASDEGNAGGITSSNSSLILKCKDYKAVNAPKGLCGGITAENRTGGVIYFCYVGSEKEVTLSSTQSVGGVAAQNAGIIECNYLENITISNKTDVENTSIGLLVGDNLTGGRIHLVNDRWETYYSSDFRETLDRWKNLDIQDIFAILDTSDFWNENKMKNCQALVLSNASKAGGIAGTNAGTVKGKSAIVISPVLTMKNATVANIGGVTGVNTGTIENIAVDATLQFTDKLGSAETGYGGIAGLSGYVSEAQLAEAQKAKSTETYAATIKNCSFDGLINAAGSSGAPVRIGGIVGVNGYGSLVENCHIGVRSEGSDTTYIAAGDYENKTAESYKTTDTKSYSYLGGIAGDNYGAILACDNEKKSTDTVQIIGFAGETGGIAGYNETYGVVSGYLDKDGKTKHYLTTGKKWSVEQRCSGNDRGPGGMIGKSVSAEDMSYVKNYASVTCEYPANTYVAGLIGLLGQQYAQKTKFYQCENFGNIASSKCAGGLVGMVESNGADFTECTNWGDVYAKSQNSGGFVSMHYAFAVGLDFRRCANHGKVYGAATNLGGFLGGDNGYINDSVNGKVVNYLYDCVNTGIVQRIGDKKASTGSFFGYTQSRVIMELCRNYNTDATTNGFVGSGSDLRFKNCLDDSGVTTTSTFTPFGGVSGWSTNMFYLDRSSKTTFSHEDYGVYFSFHEGPIGDFSYNGLRYRDQLRDPSYLFAEPDKANKIIVYGKHNNYDYRQLNISLDYDKNSQGLDSMVVYFWNGSDAADSAPVNHTHSVTATYLYSNGLQKTTDSQIAMGYYDVVPEARVILKNPIADKKPVGVRLRFADTNTEVKLRGISYIPAKESSTGKEAVCTYLGNKNHTTFNIVETLKKNSSGGIISSNLNFSQTLPADTWDSYPNAWYCYPNDVMDIDWTEYTNYRLDYAAGQCADITFEVSNGESVPGMNSFVFYLADDNTKPETNEKSIDTWYYEYSVTFTDVDGKTKTTPIVTDAAGYYSGEADYRTRSRQQVEVPVGLSSQIAKICLHIKTTKRVYEKTNTTKYDRGNIYFRGFGWIPKGQNTEQKMAAGAHPTGSASYSDRYQDSTARHTRLKVDAIDSKNYVYLPYDHDMGFSIENDPVSDIYYTDDKSYEASKNTDGGRIHTFLEIDPKFIELTEDVCTVYRKLDLPSSLAMTDKNACMQFTWGRSRDAYAYEVYYEIKDASGSIVTTSEHELIGSLQFEYNLPIDNSWKEKGYGIKFYVRAINAYHMDHDDKKDDDYDSGYEKYDSDWVFVENQIEKMALPRPEVHMEVVAGNRTTFVLDNYEEYVKKNCTDCTIKVYFKGKNYDWDVATDGKYRKPEYLEGSHGSPTEFRYYAIPNEALKNAYTSSEIHFQRGEGMLNTHLEKYDKYCDTNFRGFFGTQADSMEYQVMFTLSSLDTYLMTDITAYDETVGATVVYDSEITHAANSYSSGQLKLTSTLKNLPDEWFASDCKDKITVRAYPYHSQFDLIHYGHPVAEGIRLNGTVEENRAVLAGIYDAAYIAENENAPSDDGNCIWDEKKQDLKNGYLLRKQEDGTYDVIYSSVIELSKLAAVEQQKTDDNKYREYYMYDVAYRIYSNTAAETDNEIVVNSADYQESYWTRGMTDSTSYNTVKTDSNERKYLQEIQPAPIVNDPVITKDDQEHTVYEFSWDTYYQDTACWNNNVKRYYDKTDDKLTNPPKGLYRTWDAYLKKLTQAGLSEQQISDRSNFCGLMNVYYNSYSTAEYRVDLIGTTQEGKEVILESKTVNVPTQQDTVDDNMTTKGGKPTTYNVWDYRCSFTDTDHTWNNYPTMTARIMRLGNLSTVSFFKSGGTQVRPITDSSGATCMLPRYTDTIVTQKLRLDMISKPTVSLLNENGQFITDDLVYEVEWGAITNKKQKKDLGGYLITACLAQKEGQTQETNTHYYYVSDVGTDEDEIGLDIDVLKANGVVIDVSGNYTRSGNRCRTRINLSDFNTNDVVQISVKAIARKQAENYTDSEEGVISEIKIPKRLAVPDTSKLTVTGQAETADAIEMENYLNGLTLQYTADDRYADIADAKLRIAAAVCDSRTGEQDDSTQIAVQDWAKDAYVLYTKEKPLDMGKISEERTVTINLSEFERYPGEYAGKWLKLAMKASSATKIDSQWTDQDPDGKTTNYVWVQIPKLKLKDVDLKELSASDEGDVIRYACDGKVTNDSQDANRETPIATKSLGFSEYKNVNGYHICVTGTAISSDGKAPVYDLYLQRHLTTVANPSSFDGSWDVYLASNIDSAVSENDSQRTVCEQNPEAKWLGTIGRPFTDGSSAGTDKETAALIDIPQLKQLLQIETVNYALTAQLRYAVGAENGNGSFTLVLPDVTVVGDTAYSGDHFTTEVSVGQYIKDDAPYIAGKGAVYSRGSGIRIAAMEKGGDGQHEDDQKTATVKKMAQTTANGRFRSGDGYGIDRWSSRAGILPIPPFDHILTICANIQTDYAAAMQATGTELFRILSAGSFGSLLIPVGIFI